MVSLCFGKLWFWQVFCVLVSLGFSDLHFAKWFAPSSVSNQLAKTVVVHCTMVPKNSQVCCKPGLSYIQSSVSVGCRLLQFVAGWTARQVRQNAAKASGSTIEVQGLGPFIGMSDSDLLKMHHAEKQALAQSAQQDDERAQIADAVQKTTASAQEDPPVVKSKRAKEPRKPRSTSKPPSKTSKTTKPPPAGASAVKGRRRGRSVPSTAHEEGEESEAVGK